MNSKSQSTVDPSTVAVALRLTHSTRERQSDKRQEIMTAIYDLARARRWDVLSARWDNYPMSFHWVELKQGERQFALLLLHESSPFAALTSTLPDYLNLVFIDDDAFTSVAQQMNLAFALLRAADLSQQLTESDQAYIRALSRQHEQDLKYWKPETVGDVIFNWWD